MRRTFVMSKAVVLMLAALLLAYLPAAGHHSFAATYLENKSVTIEATVVQFLFRNPHSVVHVDAPDESGKMQRWTVEWGAAGQLGGSNIARDTLKAGDTVVITGNPGRDPSEHRIRLVKISRKNGDPLWGTRPGETFR
jgi:hypothetical protein